MSNLATWAADPNRPEALSETRSDYIKHYTALERAEFIKRGIHPDKLNDGEREEFEARIRINAMRASSEGSELLERTSAHLAFELALSQGFLYDRNEEGKLI